MDRTTPGLRRMEGKVVIVTASTAGIGLAVARRLGREGAKVVISSRKQKNVDDAVALLKGDGSEATGVVCHIDKIFDINVKAAIYLVRDAAPHMPAGSAVVFVASIAAFQPFTPLGVYGVSKTALLGLAKPAAKKRSEGDEAHATRQLCASGWMLGEQGLAVEMGPDVRVNCVAPGIVPTHFADALVSNPASKEMMEEKTALKRLGTPEDMAAAVAFLVSGDAAYITGETLVVSGGMQSRL
eukprot:jgi/Mesen1/2466/ME000158S01660